MSVKFALLLFLVVWATSVDAAAEQPLPPMRFFSTIASSELLQALQASPVFAALDPQQLGSPIILRVSHSLRPTRRGEAAGIASAVFSGATLGLLPMVSNNDLVLTYEILVHGAAIARYDYETNYTEARRPADDGPYDFSESTVQWALSTAPKFLEQIAADPQARALAEEYATYFGDRGPCPGRPAGRPDLATSPCL